MKEGRKYDLGAVLITQQPGSIPMDILSQGDNWFLFHLLSIMDLKNVQRANAHFSDDLLSSLLNEPIPGQGVFWSSVGQKPYPLPFRAASFEDRYTLQDPDYSRPPVDTYAANLRQHFAAVGAATAVAAAADEHVEAAAPAPDHKHLYEERAIEAFREHALVKQLRQGRPVPWSRLARVLELALPPELDDRAKISMRLMRQALRHVLGAEDVMWETHKDHDGRLQVQMLAQRSEGA